MQLANKWMYDKGVGRACPILTFARRIYFQMEQDDQLLEINCVKNNREIKVHTLDFAISSQQLWKTWTTVQVGSDLFQINLRFECRWLRKDGEANFVIEEIPRYKFNHGRCTQRPLCNWQDKYIFLMGNFQGLYGFNIQNNVWEYFDYTIEVEWSLCD